MKEANNISVSALTIEMSKMGCKHYLLTPPTVIFKHARLLEWNETDMVSAKNKLFECLTITKCYINIIAKGTQHGISVETISVPPK